MITDEQIVKLRKSKDDSVRCLVKWYDEITCSSAYASLLAHRATIKKWNQELSANPPTLFVSDEGVTNKDFEYALKYLAEQEKLAEIEAKLIKRITPKDLQTQEEEMKGQSYASGLEEDAERIRKEVLGKSK